MKSLFWKEIRENLKWAILAAIGITAAMWYALAPDPNSSGGSEWETLSSSSFLLISSFGFPAVALALGFLQILTELRRDQWAFLVHRPVSRNAIFWGKAFPGTALYLPAVLVPLFGVGWWVSLPGSIAAPFDWRLVNPPLWDAIAALAFYFAALQCGVMSGPWFGRRLLPLVGVCFGMIAVKNQGSFPVAVTGAVTILIISVFSAWGAFLSNGSFRNASAWGKAAMTLLGLFALSVLLGWSTKVWRIAFPADTHSQSRKDLAITQDGRPVMVVKQGDWKAEAITSVTTLDGFDVKAKDKKAFSHDDFLGASHLELRSRNYHGRWRSAETYFFRVSNKLFSPVSWYFVNGPSLFARYGKTSKSFEGWLAPQGEVNPPDRPTEGFRLLGKQTYFGNIGDTILLTCEDGIWRIDLAQNKASRIYTVATGEKMLDVDDIYDPALKNGYQEFALATDKVVQYRAGSGDLIVSFPQVQNLEDYFNVLFYRMPDRSRYFLEYVGRTDVNPKTPDVLFELSQSGEVLSKHEFPVDPPEPLRLSLNAVWAAASTPFGQTLWGNAITGFYSMLGIQKWQPVWEYQEPKRSWVLGLWAISLLSGIVSAGVGQFLFKRLEIRGRSRWAWTVFLVFFSYAGLLALALLHEWPRRKPCPSCGRKRSLERSTCESCGAPWPGRKPDGTEIFESAPSRKS